MSRVTFHHGDNREVLRQMIADGVRVQSCITDPPYGLTSITKRFAKSSVDDNTKTSERVRDRTDGFGRVAAGGFMGQSWDASGIERDPEFWRLIYDILLPGGYCLAFSSPRTGHWMAVAMETAGFVMHPFIGWCYGSGFPKAHDAAKAIDRELGQTGSVVPTGDPIKRMIPGAQQHATGDWTKTDERQFQPGDYYPASGAAQQWDGWKYGTQSMKPALEPIYVAQRPFDQKNGALNILEHGVGALNIDGCRVPFASEADEHESKEKNRHADFDSGPRDNAVYGVDNRARGANGNYNPPGRHPANLIHDGSDVVRAQFPTTTSVGHAPKFDGGKGNLFKEGAGTGGLGVRENMEERHFREADTSAARFFNTFPLDGDSLKYCPKASKADRAGSRHPTVKPIALMRWCCRLVTPPGGTVLDPFAGSGTTGAAALAEGFNCTLIEAHDDYAADIRRRFDLPVPGTVDIDALIGGGIDIMELIG